MEKHRLSQGEPDLYVQSVLYDFRFTEEAADLEVRERLEKELAEKGADHLYEKLVELDPVSAEKIHPNNHRRLVRALEIIEVTGKTKDDHENDAGKAPFMIISLSVLKWTVKYYMNESIDVSI